MVHLWRCDYYSICRPLALIACTFNLAIFLRSLYTLYGVRVALYPSCRTRYRVKLLC